MPVLRTKPPVWFWIVAALALLWSVMGIAAFYFDVATTPEQLARMPAYDRGMLASRPTWFMWLYAGSVWSGLFGAVLLLLRRGQAQPLFVLSFVLIVVMFGYILTTTDLIAVKGFLAAAGFPIVIAVIGAFQVWLARNARRRGWIA